MNTRSGGYNPTAKNKAKNEFGLTKHRVVVKWVALGMVIVMTFDAVKIFIKHLYR